MWVSISTLSSEFDARLVTALLRGGIRLPLRNGTLLCLVSIYFYISSESMRTNMKIILRFVLFPGYQYDSKKYQ